VVDEKFCCRRVICVKCPVVFVSNERSHYDGAFLLRMVVVEAIDALFEVTE
jgi:hypothetical protein